MGIIEDIVEALKGKKTPQETSILIEQLFKEKTLYEAFKSAGLTVATVEEIQSRSRDRSGLMTLLEKVNLIDRISRIDLIDLISKIALIEDITHVGTIDTITTIGNLSSLLNVTNIVNLAKINPSISSVLFADGFESGDFSKWTYTRGSPTISTVHYGTGAYSLLASGDLYSTYGVFKNLSLPSIHYIKGYFRCDSITMASGYYCPIFGESAQNVIAGEGTYFVIENVAGIYRLRLRQIGFGLDVYADSGVILSAGSWYKITLKVNTATSIIDLYINDSWRCSITAYNLGANIWAGYGSGAGSSGSYYVTGYVDEILVDDALFNYNAVIDLVKRCQIYGREDLLFKRFNNTFAGAGDYQILAPVSGLQHKVYSFGVRQVTDRETEFRDGTSATLQFGNDSIAGYRTAVFQNPFVGSINTALNFRAEGACTVLGYIQYVTE